MTWPFGDGEMAERIRAFDWAATPLGPAADWPQRLRTVVDLMLASLQPVCIGWGPERITLYNDRFVPIVGPAHPDALGRPWRPMGRVTFSWTPLRDEGGSVEGYFCAAVGTTERVLAEREREQTHRAVLETMDEGYLLADVVFDAAGRAVDIAYVDANPAAIRLVGIDLRGRRLREVSAGYEAYWYDIWGRVARTGVGERLQRYAAPENRWYDFHVFKPAPNDATSVRVAVLFHDMSERKRLEEARTASEQRLADVLDGMGEAFGLMDRDLRIVTQNKAAQRLNGRPLDEIRGRTHWDAYPGSEESEIGRLYRRALAENVPVSLEHLYEWSDGHATWLEMRAYPVREGLAVFWHDISDRKAVETERREREKRQAFLLQLSDVLRGLDNPTEIEEQATRLLARQLQVSRAVYATFVVEGDREYVAIEREHRAPGTPSLVGRYPVEAWKDDIDSLRAGRATVIPDIELEPMSEERLASWRALGARARMGVPLVKDGRLTVVLGVHSAMPRAWTAQDVELVREIGERTWAAVERARAEGALRESEERQTFLLALSDALRPLTDPLEIQGTAMRLLAERYDVLRAGYLDVEADGDTATMAAHFQRDASPVPHRIRLSEYGPDLVAAFRAGHTRCVRDTEVEGGTEAERAAHRTLGIRAWIIAPLVKAGRLIAIVGVVSRTPRDWTAAQVRGVTDLSERTWDAVQRARVEMALRVVEERQRMTLELVPALLWSAGPDGREVTFNERWLAYTGQSESETQNHGWLKAIHPDDLPGARAAIQHAFATSEPLERQQRIHKAGDGWRWHLVRHVPVHDVNGTITRWFGAAVDIHDSKLAEQALEATERRLQTLVEGVPQLVWRAVDGGSWTWASPQWTACTGQAEADSHGHGWLDPVHPDDRAAAMGMWAGAMDRGEFHADYRIRRASDGRYRWFQTRATPVRDDAGRIVEWLGTSTDVDDLRALQERQRVLVAELQHRTRNLMAVVRSTSEKMLRTSADLPEFRARFGDRLDALARVQGLLSRLDEHDRVTFDELLRMELDAMAHDAARVHLAGPPGIRLRSSTVQTLSLALHELATNALKYGALGQAGGQLVVDWRVDRDGPQGEPWLRIDWRESGVAMPAAPRTDRRRGQGRELIERALPYQLGAETSYAEGPDGIRCTIALAVSTADPTAPVEP